MEGVQSPQDGHEDGHEVDHVGGHEASWRDLDVRVGGATRHSPSDSEQTGVFNRFDLYHIPSDSGTRQDKLRTWKR